MKIKGQLFDMLVDIAPQDYQDFVCMEGNQKVLHVKMLKALYGMLQSSLLHYKRFCKNLKKLDLSSIYMILMLQTG
jgi:hypothetical protein